MSRRVDTGTRARPRVLVVDDDEDIREIHAWALRAAGWIVETVANGHEALMTGPAFGPDVIVMDLKLPVLDGVRTMQIMKRDPRLAAVPVLVCTSYEELRTEATHAGCDAFLTKPVDPDEFRQVLEGLASTTRSSPPRPPV